MTDEADRIATEIIDKARTLVTAAGYQHGQITELQMLIAEYDAEKLRPVTP